MSVAIRVVRLAGRPLLLTFCVAPLRWVATAGDVTLLLLLRRFVDQAIFAGSPGGLLGLALQAMAVGVGREAAAYAAARLATRAGTGLTRDLQVRLYGHIQSLALDFFARSRVGDLVERLFHDVPIGARLVTVIGATLLDAPLRLAALFAALYWLHPRFAWLCLAALVPTTIVGRALGRLLRRRFRSLYEDLARLYDSAQQSLSAAELLRAYGRTRDDAERFGERLAAYAQREAALQNWQNLDGPLTQTVRLLALVAAFVYGGHEVASGRLTAGSLSAILVAAYGFLGSFQSLVSLYSIGQGASAAAERLLAILDERSTVPAPSVGKTPSFRDSLSFEGVSFGYPGRPAVVTEVSLRVREGERVAIVGPTGSGKTTLVRLALRLIDPTAGRIALDGDDLRELSLDELRRLYAVVPQDAPLFDGSLRENILFGKPTATEAEVIAAAGRAGLNDLVARLPSGLDSLVGPRGSILSGGERQCVALARAAIRDAPILILDEATSAVDTEAERRIHTALVDLTRDRTLIMITHRLTSLQICERVVVLRDGRVAEDGPSPQPSSAP
jgi:ABC-type multidrug transport system fused ATPase/permease subunit